tara:strand:+ start:375 stop:650 length:276 start_codon:yes stop_codon:yes gene_type:complete
MGIWPRTPYQEKKNVQIMISDMLKEMGLTWGDLIDTERRGARYILARERACTMAFEYLIPWMSEVKISEWLGISRSTFVSARVRWDQKNRE